MGQQFDRVYMTHPNLKTPAYVRPSAVPQMEAQGWVEADPPAPKPRRKKRTERTAAPARAAVDTSKEGDA